MVTHPNRSKMPYSVSEYGQVVAKFTISEYAHAFASMLSSQQMGDTEVHLSGRDGGIVGQYVDGCPTPEFAGRADAVIYKSTQRVRILAACEYLNGRKYQQECASPDVARSCMDAFRADPTVKRAMAYYTDDRGAIDTFLRGEG